MFILTKTSSTTNIIFLHHQFVESRSCRWYQRKSPNGIQQPLGKTPASKTSIWLQWLWFSHHEDRTSQSHPEGSKIGGQEGGLKVGGEGGFLYSFTNADHEMLMIDSYCGFFFANVCVLGYQV